MKIIPFVMAEDRRKAQPIIYYLCNKYVAMSPLKACQKCEHFEHETNGGIICNFKDSQ